MDMTSNNGRAGAGGGGALLMEYQARAKSVGVAYALWIIGGWCGAHRFYLRQYVQGASQLALLVAFVLICLLLSGNGSTSLLVRSTWIGTALANGWAAIYCGWLALDLLTIPGRCTRLNVLLARTLAVQGR
jgi:TM2 domain-containing membrane protein YozV